MQIKITHKVPVQQLSNGGMVMEMAEYAADVPREAWRYLFAGMIFAANYGTVRRLTPREAVGEGVELLAELEKD